MYSFLVFVIAKQAYPNLRDVPSLLSPEIKPFLSRRKKHSQTQNCFFFFFSIVVVAQRSWPGWLEQTHYKRGTHCGKEKLDTSQILKFSTNPQYDIRLNNLNTKIHMQRLSYTKMMEHTPLRNWSGWSINKSISLAVASGRSSPSKHWYRKRVTIRERQKPEEDKIKE